MPTYEYRCPDGHEFEKFVRNMSDAVATLACPTCGVMAARRMSAGGGLLFKGSGFYITDYGKDGKKDQKDAAKAAATAAAAPATTTTPAASGPTASGPAASTPAPSAPAPSAPAKDKPKSGPEK